MTIVGVWLFFSNLIINWYSFWQRAFDLIMDLEFKYLIRKAVPTAQSFLDHKKIFVQVAGDVFSKLYILIVIIGAPLSAYFCFLSSKKLNIPFRTHFVIFTYYFSLTFITSFIVIGVLAINIYVGLIIIMMIYLARMFGLKGFYNLIMVAPVAKFFDPPNSKMEKKYTIAPYVYVHNLYSGSFYSRVRNLFCDQTFLKEPVKMLKAMGAKLLNSCFNRNIYF